jgi:deferrochelatase/peroxidase EfeB
MAKLRQGYRPSAEDALAFKAELDAFYLMARDYRYIEDREGAKCPFGAHVRRVNPRDMLDPEPKIDASGKTSPEASSRLTNRRRILRRGLPYGERSNNDADEHGVFIMALCTSLFRQFEFIQQQWLHYGLDLEAGSDACPITGRRDPLNRQANKFVVNGDAATDTPPYIAADLPLFVETRGGEYFFIPSLTALRMIAMGTIDPT